MDTFAATRSSGPQDMPEMGDEWGKWLMICTYDTDSSTFQDPLYCHYIACSPRFVICLQACDSD